MAMSKQIRWLVATLIAVVLVTAGYLYWRHGKFYPSTDDAYVEANVVQVAAQVTGQATQVYVQNQQHVHAEQPLFDIDRRPFELAVAQARARLEMARESVGSGSAAVRAAEAEVETQRVQLDKAERNAKRLADLRAKNFVSAQAYDDAVAALDAAKAQLDVANARLNQARLNLGNTGDRNQRIREAEAALKQAELDLAHTNVAAACDGDIAQLSLQPGSTVRAGNPLFALVCTGQFWVAANFKETQLERIKPGQNVDIEVDMYPGRHFEGRVENISRASGVAFSLLPPQNATGNWVKVTQRVPVRIVVLAPDPNYPLRVGTSATATVDTTRTGSTLAASQ
ncbi:MAG: efflux RND transporter periplasmic adaptor subunit [Sulfurifustaceae bacterium]